MNILVEVTDANLYDGENTSSATGEVRGYKYQKVWIHVPGEPHPSKNKRVVTKDTKALDPGFYRFDLSRAFSNWSWSRVELSTRHLVPVSKEEIAALRKAA